MKIKKYITQNLLFLFAAGWLICSTFSCTNEDIPDNSAPVLTIQEVSNALRTSAVFSGSISGETDKLKDFGFEYSTSKDFPTDQTTKVSMLESGASTTLTTQVKGLSPSTYYYYRMYATTGATTVYSEERPFNTTSMSSPQLSDLVTDSIGERYARFKFHVEDYGNEVLIECGVGYKKSDANTSFIPVASEKITEDDQYTIELIDLEPDTEYEFRAYAKNAADKEASTGSIEGYGTVVKQRTAALLSADIKTNEINEGNIKITSVTVEGTISSATGSGGIINECGFVYSETNDLPTYNSDSKIVHPQKDINVNEYKDGYTYNEEITGLLQNTHYYIRAYAKNTVAGEERTAYGATQEITTHSLNRPEVEFTYKDDGSLDFSCTATTITVKASIQKYDANALIEKGFIWSRSIGELPIDEAKKNGTYKTVDNGENQIVATIDGLEMDNSYYIRAYAIYKSGELTEIGYTNGSVLIRTEGFNLPSLGVEINRDKVTFNSAELVGKMPSSGNTHITERGFVLSTQFPEATLEKCDTAITSDEGFITNVTGLKYQTNYYVRAYAKCELGGRAETTYSGWDNFQTPDFDRPSFDDMSFSTSLNSLTMTASITAGKDGKILSRGVCAIKNEEDNTPDPTINDLKVEEAVTPTSPKSYTLEIKDLPINTSYKVRAYAIVQLGDEKIDCYGPTHWTNTEDFRLPSLRIEINRDKLTFNSAELVGKIPNSGNTGITERGFVLSTQFSEVTLEKCDKKITSDEGFITNVTGLKYQTNYYVRAYAKCKLGEKTEVVYSGSIDFQTPDFDRPSFGNMSFSASLNSLTMKISIAAGKDGKILSRGFCAIKRENNNTPNPTINDLKVEEAVTPNSPKDYTLEIKGLTIGTRYKVRAYAIVQLGDEKIPCYGSIYEKDTEGFRLPSLGVEINRDKLTFNSAELVGKIPNSGNTGITERGFVLSTQFQEVTLEKCDKKITSDEGFITTVTGLKYQTNYYVRAYAKCKLGEKTEVVYSGSINFQTPDFDRPSFGNMSVSTSLNSLTMTISMAAGKDGKILSRGFCAIKRENDTSNPTINDLKVEEAVTPTSPKAYTLEIKDLPVSTRYRVRAYAIVQLGDEKIPCYGRTYEYDTEGFKLPSLEVEIDRDKLTFNSAELVGKMPDPGNTHITERGFVLSTKFPEVTLEKCDKAITSDEGFITTVTGLKYQTNYYVRAYAKCKLGEKTEVAYSGGWNSFRTPDFDRPSFSDMSINSSLNSLTMTITMAAGKDGKILSRGFCAIKRENDTPDPTINDLKVEEKVTSENTYTLEIKSLPFNTPYKVRAYAIVQLGDEKITCYGPTYWAETQNLNVNAEFKATDTKCEARATITSNVDLSKATEYGFAWTDSDTWETSEITNKLPCNNMDTNKKFSGTIEGLTGGKKYHVWIYVTVDDRTNYAGGWEFTTKRIPGQGDNVSPDQK